VNATILVAECETALSFIHTGDMVSSINKFIVLLISLAKVCQFPNQGQTDPKAVLIASHNLPSPEKSL
jgi:hypothetical protein